jgi:pimeloyl-ACP methyl ester carboxylesterase
MYGPLVTLPTWRANRAKAFLAAAVMVLVSLGAVSKEGTADAATGGLTGASWSVPAPDYSSEVRAVSGGRVISDRCISTDGLVHPFTQSYSSTGSTDWTVSGTWACPLVADAAGNTYVSVSDATGSRVESLSPSGAVRWSTTSPDLTHMSRATISPAGVVYFDSWAGGGTGPVVGLNTATGAIVFDHAFAHAYQIYPWGNGIILVSASDVEYIDSTGTVQRQVPASGQTSLGANGVVFVGSVDTSSGQPRATVTAIASSGQVWQWQSVEGQSAASVAATPDGGVNVVASDVVSFSGTFHGTGVVEIYHLDASGKQAWAKQLPGTADNAPAYNQPVVDVNGVLVLTYQVGQSCTNGPGGLCTVLKTEFFAQADGWAAFPAITASSSTSTGLSMSGPTAIGPGSVYLLAGTYGGSNGNTELGKFTVSGLGEDYQSALVAGNGQDEGSGGGGTGSGGGSASSALVVSPPSGPAGTRFSATWSCPSGSTSITFVDSAGKPVFGTQLPVTGDGVTYSDAVTVPLSASIGSRYTATASCSGISLTPVEFTITAPTRTVLFVQGIASSSTCPGSSDFVDRVDWLRNSLIGQLGANTKFLYYAYRSPHTPSPSCGDSADLPQYTAVDTCWSLDDSYTVTTVDLRQRRKTTTHQVKGGGQASRFSTYLRTYLDAHPDEQVSIVAHSQGGILSTYTVQTLFKGKNARYAKRVHAIVTLDSPLGGVPSNAAAELRSVSGCSGSNMLEYDSSYDMLPGNSVITAINARHQQSITHLYTVDANPGDCGSLCQHVSGLSSVPMINDAHSTTWWATAHIRVAAETHSDIWNGTFLNNGASFPTQPSGMGIVPQGEKLIRFAACGIADLSSDCVSYSNAT